MSTETQIDFGYRVVTVQRRWYSARIGARVLFVSAALFAAAGLVGVVSLCFGDYPLSLGQVLEALTGGGADFARMVVLEWRLPVVVAASVFGAVLAIGGAIFQTLTHNPLGSPDVIGFDAGSYTAVVLTMLVIGQGGYLGVASSALVGGVATALAVYLLAYRGGLQGFRMIIVGIGVSAMLGSLNAYLVTRADISDAVSVGFWAAGSISRITWPTVLPALVAIAVIGVAAVMLAPVLTRLELDDDAAVAQGTRVHVARLGLMVLGVATAAVVTAAAGPIGFIALVAPQLARRLTRSSGVSLLAAAAMGAALLTSAHLLSLVFTQLYRPVPVGLVTVCLGGCYLIWLLVRETRRQYGSAGAQHR